MLRVQMFLQVTTLLTPTTLPPSPLSDMTPITRHTSRVIHMHVILQAGDVADLSGSTGAGAGTDSGPDPGPDGRAVVSSLQEALCALALLFRQVTHH